MSKALRKSGFGRLPSGARVEPARAAVWAVLLLSSFLLFSGCESDGEMVILDIDPKVGHTQGDQVVRILGKNFRQDIGYTIFFGTKKTNSVTIRDPETIEVTTPTRVDEGTVDVMIRADDGNAYRIVEAFTFKEMDGNIVEGMGAPGEAPEKDKGNLKY